MESTEAAAIIGMWIAVAIILGVLIQVVAHVPEVYSVGVTLTSIPIVVSITGVVTISIVRKGRSIWSSLRQEETVKTEDVRKIVNKLERIESLKKELQISRRFWRNKGEGKTFKNGYGGKHLGRLNAPTTKKRENFR